jgi:predicted secreted protein
VSWSEGIVVYVMLWWITLFAVLPFGVKRSDAPKPGHDPGAPERPALLKKALWTTAIASIAWGFFYAIAASGLISFRQ